jgi:hypothetical protein
MTTNEIEVLLKSIAKDFFQIEKGFAKVDNIYIDYSLSYLIDQKISFKRILTSNNILILSDKMTREQVLSEIAQMKNEIIRDDCITLQKIAENLFEVFIDNEKCAELSITDENGDFYFIEKSFSNKKANKKILAEKLMSLLEINEINFISESLYKENYYIEFLNQDVLQCNILLQNDLFFGKNIFTFKCSSFLKTI